MELEAAFTASPRVGRKMLSAEMDQRKESTAATHGGAGRGLLGAELPPSSQGLTHRGEMYIYRPLSWLVGIKGLAPLPLCCWHLNVTSVGRFSS